MWGIIWLKPSLVAQSLYWVQLLPRCLAARHAATGLHVPILGKHHQNLSSCVLISLGNKWLVFLFSFLGEGSGNRPGPAFRVIFTARIFFFQGTGIMPCITPAHVRGRQSAPSWASKPRDVDAAPSRGQACRSYLQSAGPSARAFSNYTHRVRHEGFSPASPVIGIIYLQLPGNSACIQIAPTRMSIHSWMCTAGHFIPCGMSYAPPSAPATDKVNTRPSDMVCAKSAVYTGWRWLPAEVECPACGRVWKLYSFSPAITRR